MGLPIVLLALTVVVVGFLLAPLFRSRSGDPTDPKAHDMAVYAAQLQDLERDQLDGKIETETAEEARREIERRMLALDQRRTRVRATSRLATAAVAVILALAVPAISGGLYWLYGSPTLPDKPLASREGPNDELVTVLAELEARVTATPTDADAQILYGQALFAANRYADSVETFARAVELTDSRPDVLGLYGEALVYASGGFVTAEAQAVFTRIPDLPRARFYEAVALYQAGDRQEALEGWLALAADAPAGAAWLPVVESRIESVAEELGQDPAALLAGLPEREAPPLDPAQVQAMVEGLQARLATDTPDDLDGWLMLGRSLQVLGRMSQAVEAWKRAAELAPDDADVLVGYGVALMRASEQGAPLPDETRALMEDALRLDADNVDALWFAGVGARQNGEDSIARKHWDRLLQLLPPDSEEYALVRRQFENLPANP